MYVYFIKFLYGDELLEIKVESSGDISGGTVSDKIWASEMIRSFIEDIPKQKREYVHDIEVYDSERNQLFKMRDI